MPTGILTMTPTRQQTPSRQRATSPWRMATATGVLLTLVACASAPPPTQALQAAEQAIRNAEQARVADHASPELAEARQRLTAARAAVVEEKMTKALHLAEQARADAELAIAKAAVVKAQAVNEDMRKSNTTLKQEMQRDTTGVTP